MTTQSSFWKFHLSYSFFAAGRMGIGATAVVFMLANGASLADVAMVKIAQGEGICYRHELSG